MDLKDNLNVNKSIKKSRGLMHININKVIHNCSKTFGPNSKEYDTKKMILTEINYKKQSYEGSDVEK